MFLAHHFYENSMSWANSYAWVFSTKQEALNEMYDSVLKNVSKANKEEKVEIVDFTKRQSQKEDVEEVEMKSWFTVACSKDWYEIGSEWYEDVYRFSIKEFELDSKWVFSEL